MQKELIPFIKIVDFLADALGKHTEVVLHDVTDPNNSIIAIRNGYISNRKVGGSVTDLMLEFINKVEDQDYFCNYRGFASNGNVLKSSTYFIRDSKGKIIGALCINTDCQEVIRANQYFNEILSFMDEEQDVEIKETFTIIPDEIIAKSIEEAIKHLGIEPERMSQEEKLGIVKSLQEKGIFLLKGSIPKLASELKVSEPTIYRYINLVKG